MQTKNRKYYLVRQYSLCQDIIERLKKYYPTIRIKCRNYRYGRSITFSKYNGRYHHLVSIDKKYSEYLEYFMKTNNIQFLEVYTDPILINVSEYYTEYQYLNYKEEEHINNISLNIKKIKEVMDNIEVKNNE